MSVFDQLESEVRSYCRSWPAVFATAHGSVLTDVEGHDYLDFFAGAGALNYGHNPPALRPALLDYLSGDGIVHGLDMHTSAKATFLETFAEVVLRPRGLDHKVQFPGPTGTNAIEAALKLARKVTGRSGVVGFSGGFHGMTLGALSITGNLAKRRGAGVPLTHATPMPFDRPVRDTDAPDLSWFSRQLDDPSSGLERPAAVVVETVQGEGGINVARDEWLRALADLCRRHDVLLVVDDVQMGVGRTGPFFSFESAGITPDLVCLSKSISGYGLPMALVLLRPELDAWAPGEHNGTFRGHNPAFVTATAAVETFWRDSALEEGTAEKGELVEEGLARIATDLPALGATTRGRGLARGLHLARPEQARAVCGAAYERGLLVEGAGPRDEVVKLMPPLTTSVAELEAGLAVLAESARHVLDDASVPPARSARPAPPATVMA